MRAVFELWLNSVKWMLIFIPPMMVLVFMILPIIDHKKPWQIAKNELREKAPHTIRYCVGISSSYEVVDGVGTTDKQRSYLLLNQLTLATITESTSSDDSKVHFETSRSGFWMLLGGVLVFPGAFAQGVLSAN